MIGTGVSKHMIAEGVKPISVGDFVKNTDRFMIVRPDYGLAADKEEVVKRVNYHVKNKTQYDFFFEEDNQEFYCHEFSADCLSSGGIMTGFQTKSFGFWPFRFTKVIITPSDLIRTGNIIYQFDGNQRRYNQEKDKPKPKKMEDYSNEKTSYVHDIDAFYGSD